MLRLHTPCCHIVIFNSFNNMEKLIVLPANHVESLLSKNKTLKTFLR